MSQMKLQRFDNQFLRDFRAPAPVRAAVAAEAVAEEPPPPPPPSYKEADLDHAREAGKKIGYAEGFEAGLAQAKTEEVTAARDLTHHMEKIERHITKLALQYQKLVSEQATEMNELVLMIARKVAGDALEENGQRAVETLVSQCLPVLFGKPKIAIDLAPAMLAQAKPALQRVLDAGGVTGEIEFRPSESMAASDVRIDWVHGTAQRRSEALWQEIEALLASVPPSPTVPAVKLEPKKPEPTPIDGDTHG